MKKIFILLAVTAMAVTGCTSANGNRLFSYVPPPSQTAVNAGGSVNSPSANTENADKTAQ